MTNLEIRNAELIIAAVFGDRRRRRRHIRVLRHLPQNRLQSRPRCSIGCRSRSSSISFLCESIPDGDGNRREFILNVLFQQHLGLHAILALFPRQLHRPFRRHFRLDDAFQLLIERQIEDKRQLLRTAFAAEVQADADVSASVLAKIVDAEAVGQIDGLRQNVDG